MQKSVLITGCSSGIGLESALELKRQGFWVLAACRKPNDVERMNGMGFTGILLDLDSPESVERAADEVMKGQVGLSSQTPIRLLHVCQGRLDLLR